MAVGAVWVCCLMQYHLNTSGSAIAVDAMWVCCCGCSTMLILVVALERSVQCGYVVEAVPC